MCVTLSVSPSDTISKPSGEAFSAMWSLMLSDARIAWRSSFVGLVGLERTAVQREVDHRDVRRIDRLDGDRILADVELRFVHEGRDDVDDLLEDIRFDLPLEQSSLPRNSLGNPVTCYKGSRGWSSASVFP